MSKYSHPGKEWEKYESGFVVKMADGRFVLDILANGHPEDPVIYFTEYLWEAKVWKTAKAALKGRDRVREKAGECKVWLFCYDEEHSKRDLCMIAERCNNGNEANDGMG